MTRANRHSLINLIKIIIIKYTYFVNILIIGCITITVLINIYHIKHIYINYIYNKKPVTKNRLKKVLAIVSDYGKIEMSLQADGLAKGAVYQFRTATD